MNGAPSIARKLGKAAVKPGKGRAAVAPPVPAREGRIDLGQGALIVFKPGFFPSNEAKTIFEALQSEVEWEQKEITVMGRKVMQPRLLAYMADDVGLAYTYSRTQLQACPWSPTVLRVKEKLEELAGVRFNSCLLNYYRDGRDSMGWHSDNEPLYGQTPTIGSASFGAARDFVLRRNADHSEKLGMRLGGGDVLLMEGSLQQHWMHAVPKRSRPLGGRINLTFRTIINKERRLQPAA